MPGRAACPRCGRFASLLAAPAQSRLLAPRERGAAGRLRRVPGGVGAAEGICVGGAEVGQEPLTLSPAIRLWRDRSFTEQMARLQRRWLAKPTWIEGDAQGRRRRLGGGVGSVPPQAARSPRRIWPRSSGTRLKIWPVGSPRAIPRCWARPSPSRRRAASNRPDGDTGRRRAAIAEVVAVTLETAVRWFGLVDDRGEWSRAIGSWSG